MGTDNHTRLVLWDIDHTLIESRGVGRTIYERVFPQVTGKPLRELATVQGRTELDIIDQTLRLHDIEPTATVVESLATALAEGYHIARTELARRGRVLPGVDEALKSLAREARLHQSVLTGNTAAVARIKMETFGLAEHLDLSIGAYGDDHTERAELVTLACKRAARHLGTRLTAERVVLIGDTPNDVDAAIRTSAHIIAVAGGKYSTDDLAAAGATTVLENLTDLPALRQAVLTR